MVRICLHYHRNCVVPQQVGIRRTLAAGSRPGDRGISIALAIHSFDPTKDAIFSSVRYSPRVSYFSISIFRVAEKPLVVSV